MSVRLYEDYGEQIQSYGENSFDSDYSTVLSFYKDGPSLAEWIISSVFGLDLIGTGGSYLPGYDVKSRDAYQMVQLSLTSELVDGKIVECYATSAGAIDFYEIGSRSFDSGSVLYSIKGESLTTQCDNVMVTGYNPPPKRYTGAEFNLFTFASLDYNPSPPDPDAGTYPVMYVMGDLWPFCNYYREGYIEYGKTNIDQVRVLQDSGVYDPKRYEEVITWMYKVTVPFYEAGNTTVEFLSTTPKLVMLDGFGKLQQREWVPSDGYYVPPVCLEPSELDADVGVTLPYSAYDKFLGVKDVIVFGYKLDKVSPYYTGEGIYDGFITMLNTMVPEPKKLERGNDYILSKLEGGGHKIVFSANTSPDYSNYFGGVTGDNGTFSFKVHPLSIVNGMLKDRRTVVSDNQTFIGKTFFPIGEGREGYIVEDIVVVYDWDNPCIKVTDLRNNVTLDNLNSVEVLMYPIIMQDKPEPVAVNGNLLDPTEVITDVYPETVETLSTTTYAEAFASLESGDIKVTLPFADENECATISSYIKSIQDRVAEDVVHVCGPDAEPELGDSIDGSIINSIDYVYQDSSQYLITVHAGPIWKPLAGWDNSIYKMKTEKVTLEGMVVEALPNNVSFSVQVNRLGVMECINTTNQIISVGDKVQISVFNNPVEM